MMNAADGVQDGSPPACGRRGCVGYWGCFDQNGNRALGLVTSKGNAAGHLGALRIG
jgi:hypothetical protein